MLTKAVWYPFSFTDFFMGLGFGVVVPNFRFFIGSVFFGLTRIPAGLGTYMFSANLRLILSLF